MAETDTTPIYCTGSGANDALCTAMTMCNGLGNQWNNPFIYLVWMMFANRFFGNGYGPESAAVTTAQNSEIMAKLNDLGSQMSTNQNTNLMMDAISGNHEALHTLQMSLGVDYANLTGAINQVQNAITAVGGQVGMSSKDVINSVLLGNKDLIAALQSCCCENKMLTMQNAADTRLQLANIASANQLQQSQIAAQTQVELEGIRQTTLKGFSDLSYQGSQSANAIIQANERNTQRIIDQLNTHWTAELSQELQNAKFEQSQLKQNVYLGGLINGNPSGASVW